MLRIIIDVLIAVGAFFALAGTLGILKMPDTFVALVLTTNPVGAHAIAKGAYQAGIRPEKKMEIDDYRRDFDE